MAKLARRRGKIVKITPTNNVTVGERPFNSFFTPNWDKEPGAAQQMDREAIRAAKGQIVVSPGRGVTRRE